ncbi:DUF5753 domain-containing protein [Nocardia sp. NPDC052566]|uniref:DUF5753 domain-containing protein n=1 Tax=Nocardia sp. NPDC052566 TaxID=3364330 RepID=UPI0037C5C8AC
MVTELARQLTGSVWWHRESDWLPGWFDTYLGMEQAARLIRCYEAKAVPELLQTADYARSVLALAHPTETEEALRRRVAVRIRRQRILTRPDPPLLWVILEESALRRPIGGSAVWRAQLDHLLRAAQAPNIAIQVLADHVGGPAVTEGSFSVLRFAEGDLPDIVYLQQLTRGVFLDDSADIEAYLAVADLLSVHAAPPEYTPELIRALRERHPPTIDEPSRTR